MVGSQRDIKRRIRSVQSIQQITRAMQLVSAAKLRRVQKSVLDGRPYVNKLDQVIHRLAYSNRSNLRHPLLKERKVQRAAYCVITADRGLAGGYNISILRLAQDALNKEEHPYSLTVVGHKGRDFFRKNDFTIDAEHTSLGDDVSWEEAKEIAKHLMNDFLAHRVDVVHLVYTQFQSAIAHKPVIEQLIPLPTWPGKTGVEDVDQQPYIVEPSLPQVLDVLIPRYIKTKVHRALLEAKASEHGARMVAMRNATENAKEMIDDLTLSYNRARQASITTEISEIVGGAQALAGPVGRGG